MPARSPSRRIARSVFDPWASWKHATRQRSGNFLARRKRELALREVDEIEAKRARAFQAHKDRGRIG
eukprot:2269688-Pyramimonas_sp.AAC.1